MLSVIRPGLRPGGPWRALPERVGPSSTAQDRFRRRTAAGGPDTEALLARGHVRRADRGRPRRRPRLLVGDEGASFRSRMGSSDLDNRGLKDRDRVTEFLAPSSVNSDRQMLSGFAYGRGTDDRNHLLSEARAHTMASALEQRGV